MMLICDAAFAQATHQPLALNGQPAPGTPSGINFGTFGNRPVINGSGQGCFLGNLTGTGVSGSTNSGLWAGAPGNLQLYVREGSQAPGTETGATFSGFYDAILNGSGVAAFPATLRNVSTSVDYGIWVGSPGNMVLAAREGYGVPGVPGAVFNGMSSLVLNGQGQIAFYAVLAGGGVNFANDTGVWVGYPGQLSPAGREGNLAPGLTGALFGSFFAPVLNDSGQVAFRSTLTPSGLADIAIWRGSPGNLACVARKSTPAPQAGLGVLLEVLGDPGINNTGQLVFATTLSGAVNSSNDEAIYRATGATLEIVVRKGQTAPGAGGAIFSNLSDPVINAGGAIAFRGTLSGSGVSAANDEGFWCGVPGNLHLVAREGAPAAGTSVNFYSFSTPLAMNSAGRSTFLAKLAGNGVSTSNDTGLWSSDASGNLSLVARKGDTIQLGGGDVRTISTLNLIYSLEGGEDGRLASINNGNQIAYHAGFVGGTQGVMLATPGAPPADECPNDPAKTQPGVCGCGVPDNDSDGDGVADCQDRCLAGNDNADADSDGIPDACDNCPSVSNANQADSNQNGVGDVCEPPSTRSILQWRSTRSHGTSGWLPIVLNPSASGNGTSGPTVESRVGGIQRIEVAFNGSVTLALPAAVLVTGRSTINGVLGNPVTYLPSAVALSDASTLVLTFSAGALPDRTCYTLQLGAGALLEPLTGATSVMVRALAGDAGLSGEVALSDALLVRSAVGQPAGAFPQFDLNATGGTIDMADALVAKAKVASPRWQALCP